MVKNMPKASVPTKSKRSSKNEETRTEEHVAKESLSDWDGNVKAAKRMEWVRCIKNMVNFSLDGGMN